jgi:hypothetical protein
VLNGASPVSERPADEERMPTATVRRAPPAALLVALFLAIAVGLTFPNVTRLRTYLAGDSGDSLLTLWIVRRVQIGLPHGWHALWDPPIYYPARATLAYSDTLIPVALVEWPLRLVLGDVLAMNVIYLGSWVASSWCVYRLAARFVRHWGAAFVAALVYTYAAVRLIHQQHFQLVVGGALIPLVLLLLLRLFDRPTVARGVVLGLSIVAVVLSASYFGALTAVVVVIVAGGLLVVRRGDARRCLGPLAAAAGVVVVLVAPFALKYAQLQRHPEFRRAFDPTTATHIGDLAATGVHSYLLDHVPFIQHASSLTSGRGIENRLFPGFVAIGFGAVGLFFVVARWRRRDRDGDSSNARAVELTVFLIAGVAGLVLSFGDWVRIGGHRVYLPFDALRRFLPGFAGIRATARLELAFQLALALLAAVGVDALLARIPARRRAISALVLAAIVVAECAMSLVSVKVPTAADDGGVDTALRARPRGVVLELPINSANRGLAWADAESPRQLLALRDHDPRVNGYSGFQPRGFDLQAAVLDHFPAPDALGLAHRLGVRYVVLRTELVGALSPANARAAVDKDGAGRYDPQTAAALIARLPAGAASAVVRLTGGYLVELSG